MQDYKHYRAPRRLNHDRIISVLLGLFLIVALCVKLPDAGAEQSSQAITECAPTMEMGMPIAIEDWVRT